MRYGSPVPPLANASSTRYLRPVQQEPPDSAPIEPDPVTQLSDLLHGYRRRYPNESAIVDRFLNFLATHENAFQRGCLAGHITGSALIVDPSTTMTLLVHHRKLDKWLQPGGHCEPGETALQAAVREAIEETGALVTPVAADSILDIDIHTIPERADSPEHLHYDVRFLLVAPIGQATTSEESHAVAWVSFDEAKRRNPEGSISRMLAKASALPLDKATALSSPTAQ